MSTPVMDLKAKLLGSIAARRLVLVCGAGLSMSAPSRLPSATVLAERCFDSYRPNDPGMPAALRGDLEGLANYFLERDTLVQVFIHAVVPWRALVAAPNIGHDAVADLLMIAAVDHAITTNVDQLIKKAIRAFPRDFPAPFDAREAPTPTS